MTHTLEQLKSDYWKAEAAHLERINADLLAVVEVIHATLKEGGKVHAGAYLTDEDKPIVNVLSELIVKATGKE